MLIFTLIFIIIIIYLVYKYVKLHNLTKAINDSLTFFYLSLFKALYLDEKTREKTKIMIYAFDDILSSAISWREYNKIWKTIAEAWKVPYLYEQNDKEIVSAEKIIEAIENEILKLERNPDMEPLITSMVDHGKHYEKFDDYKKFLKSVNN